jgi:hypothetical protein
MVTKLNQRLYVNEQKVDNIISHFRKNLNKYRKKYSFANIIVTHNIIPLFNPNNKNYRNCEDKDILSWFIHLSLGSLGLEEKHPKTYIYNGTTKNIEYIMIQILN